MTLERSDAGKWTQVGSGATDADGRAGNLGGGGVGTYRLTFALAAYLKGAGTEPFFPEATIVFEVRDATQKYHVPLLLSPFGYSTYRGS